MASHEPPLQGAGIPGPERVVGAVDVLQLQEQGVQAVCDSLYLVQPVGELFGLLHPSHGDSIGAGAGALIDASRARINSMRAKVEPLPGPAAVVD